MILQTSRGPLHYEVAEPLLPWVREPEAIVFCHGVATNCDIWANWLPVLAPRHRIVRFDTRGFGRSFDPAYRIEWDIDLLADDILAVADAAGVSRFHLVGESMGGTVCLRLASRPEPRLLSLACVSTSHQGSRIRRVGEWRQLVASEGIAAWSDRMMADRFAPAAVSRAEYEWFSDVQRLTPMDSLLGAADMLVRTDLSEALGCIAVPVLLMAPDSSPFLPLEIPADIHALIPESEVVVFPGVRHGLAFSHGAACAELLRAFIEKGATRPEP